MHGLTAIAGSVRSIVVVVPRVAFVAIGVAVGMIERRRRRQCMRWHQHLSGAAVWRERWRWRRWLIGPTGVWAISHVVVRLMMLSMVVLVVVLVVLMVRVRRRGTTAIVVVADLAWFTVIIAVAVVVVGGSSISGFRGIFAS